MGEFQTQSTLSQVYTLIESGSLRQAQEILNSTLSMELGNSGFIFVIQCCNFWINIFDKIDSLEPFEQGEILITEWERFQNLLKQTADPNDRIDYVFRKCIYNKALEKYKSVFDEKDPKLHAEIYRKMGLCYKRLGSYEDALSCLQEANSSYQGQAYIVAEMADCYDLCGESKLSKLLFREAFYIDADKVQLGNLDSPLIKGLEQRVTKEGYTGIEVQQWISVYGILLGVLNIKRPLRSQEVGRLKQDIYARENELKDPANNLSIIKPRLLNLYLWLMDNYLLSKENVSRINEVLLKIKILDSSIYKEFFSFDEAKSQSRKI